MTLGLGRLGMVPHGPAAVPLGPHATRATQAPGNRLVHGMTCCGSLAWPFTPPVLPFSCWSGVSPQGLPSPFPLSGLGLFLCKSLHFSLALPLSCKPAQFHLWSASGSPAFPDLYSCPLCCPVSLLAPADASKLFLSVWCLLPGIPESSLELLAWC